MDEIKLLRGAEPFFYPGNDVGCLLIHGLTGTPFEMRWLGQHLNQQGYTVHGPRLAGHGTTPDDLAYVTWREWYACVLAGYTMLRSQCRKIFVIGLSMGAVLTLLFSSREPVDGLVSMSAPYNVDDWRRPLMPLLRHFIKTIPKGDPPPEEDPFQQHVLAEQLRRGEDPTGHPNYPYWVVPAIGQLFKLLEQMRAGLPYITAPALLIHSRADTVVPFENLQPIYDAISSQDKQKLVLEKSDHCVAEHLEYPLVFDTITKFIDAHL